MELELGGRAATYLCAQIAPLYPTLPTAENRASVTAHRSRQSNVHVKLYVTGCLTTLLLFLNM